MIRAHIMSIPHLDIVPVAVLNIVPAVRYTSHGVQYGNLWQCHEQMFLPLLFRYPYSLPRLAP